MDNFEPEPIRPAALWESIVESLRRAIILGELAPGLHLEEPGLSEKFRVSRIPIREALAKLEREGMVRIEPRRGAFVVGVGETDIHDIYEIRRLIESYALRRAAEQIDGAGLARLQALVDQMEVAIRRDQQQRVAGPDVDFHRQIVASARNPRLLAAWDPIGGLVATILGITDALHPDISQTLKSHQAMVDALAHHDADRAEELLREHLRFGEEVMRGALHQVNNKFASAHGFSHQGEAG